jgi:hypothetical protein
LSQEQQVSNQRSLVIDHSFNVRAADAKEVGVGNPAEETYCHPDNFIVFQPLAVCQYVIVDIAAVQSVAWGG